MSGAISVDLGTIDIKILPAVPKVRGLTTAAGETPRTPPIFADGHWHEVDMRRIPVLVRERQQRSIKIRNAA